MKKVLSVFLIVTMLFTCLVPVFAEPDPDTFIDDEIIEEYAIISSLTGSIYRSGLVEHCSVTLTTKTSASMTLLVKLQKKNSDGTWTTKETWTNSGTGTSLSINETKVVVGGTYRLYVKATAGTDTLYNAFYE